MPTGSSGLRGAARAARSVRPVLRRAPRQLTDAGDVAALSMRARLHAPTDDHVTRDCETYRFVDQYLVVLAHALTGIVLLLLRFFLGRVRRTATARILLQCAIYCIGSTTIDVIPQ